MFGCDINSMTTTEFGGDWTILAMGVLSFMIGYFLYRYPDKTIQHQINLYRHLNWRMEPINRKKEVHDTRVMGLFSIFCSVWILTVYFLRSKSQ